MGVLNVTPDSFSDGGRFHDTDRAVEHGIEMAAEGADLIDVGGESTRPGSTPVSEGVELGRVLPVVRSLVENVDVAISVDTQKPAVARECLAAGASVVNDVQGLRDPAMIEVVANSGASAVIMHMRGTSRTMQRDTEYGDVVAEIAGFLERQSSLARNAGVREIAIDPGLGFGKSAQQNFQILARLREFERLGHPVLVGPSRKSFLGSLASDLPTNERLEGTLAAVAVAAMNGASVVRVHDVRACRRVLDVVDAVSEVSDAR